MESIKTPLKVYIASLVFFGISAASVFLVASIPEGEEGLTTAGMLVGILFWTGIVLGVITFLISWLLVKRDSKYLLFKKSVKPGAISFGKTKQGIIVDCGFVIFLILTILGNVVIAFPDVIMMFCVFLMLYTFYLHFMLNGKVYRYITKIINKGERK
ncbi:MAG: hypothetical protein J5983_01140 [Ruminococcus sp.]|nr:hypothetical protein [Ruminococcus sp.]